ncbi:hypothetical protein [Butyrivibrio proteoclasticus]|uniref:hypothetical protein n=1 Tax=Butyrivibrio proteoclasticus TaxID=43305 RepID=UPI0004799EEE|nr:hypothetical protein [Butyrivibrio proteoclasticus]
MKKSIVAALIMALALSAVACGKKEDNADIIGGADEPTSIYLPATGSEDGEDASESAESYDENSASEEANTSASTDTSENTAEDKLITDDEALLAIQKYCYENNSELENIVNSGEYTVYWEIESSDASQIVVMYRSYTAAIIRYYIDPVSGETYVTEFVPGITEEEERTDESLNVRDYMD